MWIYPKTSRTNQLPSNNTSAVGPRIPTAYTTQSNTHANVTFNIRNKIMTEIQIQQLAGMKHILRIHEADLQPPHCEWYRLIEVSPFAEIQMGCCLNKERQMQTSRDTSVCSDILLHQGKCRNNAECAAFLRGFLFANSTAATCYRTQTLGRRLRSLRITIQ